MTFVTHTLGSRLKAERESRGLTLTEVAASTKIPSSLLGALERNDLSRWPKGLYRRAFFRSYVTALGLQPEPLLLEFARMCPDATDSDSVAGERLEVNAEAPVEPPLALSWAGPSPAHRTRRSVGISLLEVLAVVATGGVLAWTMGMQLLAGIGAIALVYYPAVRAAAGRSRTPRLVGNRATGPAAGSQSGSGLRSAAPRLALAASQAVERCRPVATRLTTATTSVITPAAGRTTELLKVGGRGTRVAFATAGSAAGHGLGQFVRMATRVSTRAVGVVSRTFWKGVRSAAEHAELLASRQLRE